MATKKTEGRPVYLDGVRFILLLKTPDSKGRLRSAEYHLPLVRVDPQTEAQTLVTALHVSLKTGKITVGDGPQKQPLEKWIQERVADVASQPFEDEPEEPAEE